MKITLWTIQNEIVWNELQTQGKFIPKVNYIDESFLKEYDWMKLEMEKRLGESISERKYPIWSWYQYIDKNKKKPDLRRTGHLAKGETGYRIEIQKNRKEVLLSDFELWHHVLNNQYLPKSEQDEKDFELRMKLKYGNTKPDNLMKYKRKVIEKSWERIFNMDFENPYVTYPLEKKSIQATFWELKIEEVIKVDKFKPR